MQSLPRNRILPDTKQVMINKKTAVQKMHNSGLIYIYFNQPSARQGITSL